MKEFPPVPKIEMSLYLGFEFCVSQSTFCTLF